ncbi:AP-5 complex subunit zeta-1-like isoform X1 [Ptychodera flava]|uniref:AP-5 complex subunit zeta-1-like isoform X1 n=1 Tax=Ptychodera flava TaxID=63121 RepID=UPI00396A9A30
MRILDFEKRYHDQSTNIKMAAPLAVVVENLFERTRAVGEREFKEFTKKLTATLQSSERGNELIQQLRQLFLFIFCAKLDINLSQDVVTLLKKVLIESSQGSGKIRLACMAVLREYSPTELLSIENFNPPLDTAQIPYLLPVISNQGRALGHLDSLLPQIVRWVSTVGFDQGIQTRSLAYLANLILLHRDALSSEQLHVVSSQLAEWLRNASIYQAPNPYSRKLFRGEQELVTDIDGTPSRDIFTVLSIGQYLSGDQLLNIHSFSMLKNWLLLSRPAASTVAPPDTKALTESMSMTGGFSDRAKHVLREKAYEYCLRIIDQCERKPMKGQDYDLQHACLVEALSVLDILCTQDSSLVPRLFPTIKRVYSQISDNVDYPRVHLALVQFFLNHGETVMYDPQPAMDTYFGRLVALHYNIPSTAFDTVMFLQDNLEVLCLNTNIMEKYFPNLLKILAWNPRTFLTEYIDILPSMLSANTAAEMLHTLLDLPCMTAALEVAQKASRFDTTTMSGSDLLVVPGGSLEAYLMPTNKPLFKFVTRQEAGHGDTIDRLNTLHKLISDMRFHPRVTVCGQAVPVLLHLYFQTVLEYGAFELVCKLVPMILERSAQLYGEEVYKKEVRRVLADNLLVMFKLHPSLVIEVRSDLTEFIEALRNDSSREDFFIHVVWLIGEYCSSAYDERCIPETISKYYESLETLTYEISMSIQSSTDNKPPYSVRLLTILMSALAKLASRCQDLIPRVLLCLSKISKQQTNSRLPEDSKLALIGRANELVNLLKLPNIASAILSPPADIESGKWHTDNNTSLPMLLQSTTNIMQQLSL